MFTTTKTAENRLDIVLSGSLDADQMGQALDDLIALSEGISKGRMLYTITDFAMPTMGAFAVEMTRLPKLLGLVGKFARCAVLCDTDWIRTAAEIEGALIPGLTIKTFGLSETEAAEAWLAADTS